MSAFELWCIKFFFDVFLPPSSAGEDYYEVLGVNRRAKPEEIRRAYRRLARNCHPDKKQQRDGGFSSSVDAQEFKRLHEAYEALIDPKKRRMFDALGAKGMQYVINPRSVSFQEILSNFGTASCWKRTKLAAIISTVFLSFLLQPILICVNIDKTTMYFHSFAANPYWPWAAVLTPLWIFDVIVLAWLGSQFSSNNIDQDGEEMEEGAEPNNTERHPKNCQVCTKEVCQRSLYPIFRIFRHLLLVLVEIFLALKLDGVINFNYSVIFTPLYLHQFLYLAQLICIVVHTRADINRMVTLRYLERVILKRPYSDLSDDEKKVVSNSFIIVHSPLPDPDDEEEGHQHLGTTNSIEDSEEFRLSQEIALESQKKLFYFPFRAIFLGLLIPRLDNKSINWNWWLVFFPLWIVIFFSCCCILIDVAKSTADAMYIVKVAKNDPENLPDQANEITPRDAATPEANKKINSDTIPYAMKTQEDPLDEENVASRVETENVQQFTLMPLEDGLHSVSLSGAHKCVLIGNNNESQVEADFAVETIGEPRLSSSSTDEVLQRGRLYSPRDGNDIDGQDFQLQAAESHACEPFIEEQIKERISSSKLTVRLQHLVSVSNGEILQGKTDRSGQNFNIDTSDTHVDLRPAATPQNDTSSPMEVNMSTIQLTATSRLVDGQPIPDPTLSESDQGQEPPPTPGRKIEDDDNSYEYFLMSDENASKNVSRLALEKCCGLIWILLMSCLFVGKLQGAGYSALWIIFPVLLPAGCCLLSICCVIYCSTAEDADSQEVTDNNEDVPIIPEVQASTEDIVEIPEVLSPTIDLNSAEDVLPVPSEARSLDLVKISISHQASSMTDID